MRIPFTDLDVSSFCLGSCGLGSELSVDDSCRLLDRFAELGGNFVDSAHVYDFWIKDGLGKPEKTIGEWIRRSGFRPTVATKGGHPHAGADYERPSDFLSPERISQDIIESLYRLGISTIDLYYLHRDDGVTDVSEILDVLNAEIDAGRIRYLGASNWSAERIAAANSYAASTGKVGFSVCQNQWSLAVPTWAIGVDPTVRYVAAEDVPHFQRMGIAIAPYSATATGYFGSNGEKGPSFQSEANWARLERARTHAEHLGVSPNQVALAWLLNQPLPVIPILGTKNFDHLEDAMNATAIHLAPEQLRWLRDGEQIHREGFGEPEQ